MIAQYEADTRTPDLDAPRPYGLTQSHKHLPEMQQISRLTHAPIFAPIVADYYAGMQVTIPLFRQQLNCTHPVEELTACLKAHYAWTRRTWRRSAASSPRTLWRARTA